MDKLEKDVARAKILRAVGCASAQAACMQTQLVIEVTLLLISETQATLGARFGGSTKNCAF